MRILFLHPNFPAQFRHVATLLGKDPNNEVVFGCKVENPEWQIPGVRKVLFKVTREARPETHHYVRFLENGVLHGQAMFRVAEQLKSEGFIPDIIYGHSGWGPTLFMKDAFPNSKLMCYFEWFYHAIGSDADFDPADPLNIDDMGRIRIKNTPILVDLYSCDWGISPTHWQKSQFPKEFHHKISVLHDGVDTDYFKPNPEAKLILPNLDLSEVDEIVTYVTRGMEPYRGFPEFIESLAYLQERRPNCHVVIVGSDRVCYGRGLPNGETYKQHMLKKVPLDLSRVHFVGSLPYGLYLKVIQASSAHVYLTRPFVLSWSMIESMSTGCLVIGSDTPPVAEVIQDGENGLLVDFFSPKQIADKICQVLDHPTRMAELRQKARQTALERYSHQVLLPQHIRLIQDVANGRLPELNGVATQSVSTQDLAVAGQI
ncbi:MAG TPA: glycosyltransferase family 4 protein [Leptolyngbyaceae cyanobacterium]